MDTAASVEQAVGYTRLSMAMVHLGQGRLAEALALAQPALALFERLVREQPPNIVFTDGVFSAGNLTAHIAVRLGDTAGALAASSATWAAVNQLVASEGAASKWGVNRPWAAVWHGSALQMAGRDAEAEPVLAECLAHWAAEVERAPAAPTAHRSARRGAQAAIALVRAQRALGRPEAARATLAQAWALLERPGEPPERTAEYYTPRLQLAQLADTDEGPVPPAQRRAWAEALAALPRLAPDQRAAAEQGLRA
jgi:hypothetical protein